MRQWLIRLYPRRWRQRYADEFAALLAQRSLTRGDVFDVIWSAFDAHWSIQSVIGTEDLMTTEYLRLRIHLLLVIGMVLVFRSSIRPDTVVFGFDLVGVIGLTCLVLAATLSHCRSRLLRA